jgi:hypothetical protein
MLVYYTKSQYIHPISLAIKWLSFIYFTLIQDDNKTMWFDD